MPRTFTPKPKAQRACALCYAPLADAENHIHDSHRGTPLGQKYLEQLEKPRINVSRTARQREVAVINGKKGGRPKGSRTRKKVLTDREKEAVNLLADGYKVGDMGVLLSCSPSSARNRLERAKRKTNSKTLYELVAKVIKEDCQNGEHRRDGEGQEDQEDRAVASPEPSEAAGAGNGAGTRAREGSSVAVV